MMEQHFLCLSPTGQFHSFSILFKTSVSLVLLPPPVFSSASVDEMDTHHLAHSRGRGGWGHSAGRAPSRSPLASSLASGCLLLKEGPWAAGTLFACEHGEMEGVGNSNPLGGMLNQAS